MPAKVKVRILAARDLPVMDRASDLTDAFVEVRFGSAVHKTDVCRKTLNPQWNSEWFKFEVDDEDLQDEPLQIRVLDHDTYSAHDAIGKLYIDLNPLLTKESASVISGWFPLYDTMHGIRGELNIVVKVDLFSDFNKFRQSSCGVQFFDTSGVPANHRVTSVLGFIEELVVNDDPEYQWIDKIRTPRASNEARQRLFSQLSGELQRKIGLKVLEMGGNAVLGYRQCFDLEGESGIVVRAIGTSAHVQRLSSLLSPPSSSPIKDNFPLSDEPTGSPPPSSPTSQYPLLHRRSSESDLGSPPKGIRQTRSLSIDEGNRTAPQRLATAPMATLDEANSLTGSIGSGGGSGGAKTPFHRPVIQQHSIDMLEYPFFTIRFFPPGFIVHLGGVVSARSVKLLDRIHNPDEPETRDAWWTELRTEIRSHARAMGCHAVLGYSEATSICDEIIILSAMGTAATINLGPSLQDLDSATKLLTVCQPGDKESKKLHVDVGLAQRHQESELLPSCSPCHVPYHEASAPFPIQLQKCYSCRRGKVPDVLFNTIELPAELPIVGRGCMIQARVCHQKKDLKSEANAKEVSDILPFVEYELHRQLLSKLKVKAMNALFGLKTDVSVGEDVIIAVGFMNKSLPPQTATCVYLESLPQPLLPKIAVKAESPATKTRLLELQKMLIDRVNKNKERYDIHPQEHNSFHETAPSSSPRSCTDESEDELNDLDLSAGNKDAFIIEVDDEDEDLLALLLDSRCAPPDGFDTCNTEAMPGVPNFARVLQTFTHVWRGLLQHHTTKQLSRTMDDVLQSIYFKLRRAPPCAICNLDFTTYITDENQLLISVTGVVVGLSEPTHPQLLRLSDKINSEHEDMMFHMEVSQEAPLPSHKTKLAKLHRSDRRVEYYTPLKQKFGIEVTPLATIPGARIESYIGNLNFFFIRESTSVRESGGMSGFMNSFIAEVFAIIRANVAALGGNALVSFSLRDCILLDNPHKNQGQSLINVCGDVVQLTYEAMDTHSVTAPINLGGVSPVFKTPVVKCSPIMEQGPQQLVTAQS